MVLSQIRHQKVVNFKFKIQCKDFRYIFSAISQQRVWRNFLKTLLGPLKGQHRNKHAHTLTHFYFHSRIASQKKVKIIKHIIIWDCFNKCIHTIENNAVKLFFFFNYICTRSSQQQYLEQPKTEQPNWSSVLEWINKLCYVITMECYTAMRINIVLLPATILKKPNRKPYILYDSIYIYTTKQQPEN